MSIPGSTLERPQVEAPPVIDYGDYNMPFRAPEATYSPADTTVAPTQNKAADFIRQNSYHEWPTVDQDKLPAQIIPNHPEADTASKLLLHSLKLHDPIAAEKVYAELPKHEQTSFDRFEAREVMTMTKRLGGEALQALGVPRPKNVWVSVHPNILLAPPKTKTTGIEAAAIQQGHGPDFHRVAPGQHYDQIDAMRVPPRKGLIGKLRSVTRSLFARHVTR